MWSTEQVHGHYVDSAYTSGFRTSEITTLVAAPHDYLDKSPPHSFTGTELQWRKKTLDIHKNYEVPLWFSNLEGLLILVYFQVHDSDDLVFQRSQTPA